MIAAHVPIQRAVGARLLVVDEHGVVSHHVRAEFLDFVRPGDVVIANDAATLPASLFGTHAPTGRAIELRLAARHSLMPDDVTRFTAVVFGAGDFRTPTEHRALPPPMQAGDSLRLGPLTAVVTRVLAHPRLVDVRFENRVSDIWAGLARHGHPIQYAYVPKPLAIWDTWTRIAGQPVAFEAPSAGFILDWASIRSIRDRGGFFATITHAAGISSTGDDALDALLPFDEPYQIPASTAALIGASRHNGRRVIAIGTTVVEPGRAASEGETGGQSSRRDAAHRAGRGAALSMRSSGTHEKGTSHYELLRAFQDDVTLHRMEAEAEALGYRTHEFGDSALLVRSRG
jgi:S-adenosylmethionine:tRNA ribosyltransferase-isomerase